MPTVLPSIFFTPLLLLFLCLPLASPLLFPCAGDGIHASCMGSPFPIFHANWSPVLWSSVLWSFATSAQRLKTALNFLFDNCCSYIFIFLMFCTTIFLFSFCLYFFYILLLIFSFCFFTFVSIYHLLQSSFQVLDPFSSIY